MSKSQDKLKRLLEMAEEPELVLFKRIEELSDRVDVLETTPREELEPIRQELIQEAQEISQFLSDTQTELVKDINERLSNIKPIKGDKGDPGKDADENRVVDKVLRKIPPKETIVREITKEISKDIPAEIKPEEVRDKLETLKEDKRLDIKAIKGLDLSGYIDQERLDRAISILDQRTQFLINKKTTQGITSVSWDQITGSPSDNADLQDALDAITGPSWVKEEAVGDVDGVNDTYTITHTPVENSLHFYFLNNLNGVYLAEDVHYTLTDKTITVVTPRPSGTPFAQYQTLDDVTAEPDNFIFQDGNNYIYQDGNNKIFN